MKYLKFNNTSYFLIQLFWCLLIKDEEIIKKWQMKFLTPPFTRRKHGNCSTPPFTRRKHGVGVEPTKRSSAGFRSTVVPPVHKYPQ